MKVAFRKLLYLDIELAESRKPFTALGILERRCVWGKGRKIKNGERNWVELCGRIRLSFLPPKKGQILNREIVFFL